MKGGFSKWEGGKGDSSRGDKADSLSSWVSNYGGICIDWKEMFALNGVKI